MASLRGVAFVIAACVGAGTLAGTANGALFFLFRPTTARPAETVAIRLGGTPANFRAPRGNAPHGDPMRLFLVPIRVADAVRTRFDTRLTFIGRLVPDRNGHGLMRFSVPKLKPGRYVAAVWCPACATYSRGRTFFVLTLDGVVPRYRKLMVLDVR